MSIGHGTRNTLRGILLLVASVSLFGVVDGLSKVMVETQSFGQIMLARYALALPVLFLVTSPERRNSLFRTAKTGFQILRGIAPVIIGGAMVIAVNFMPLAEATVILFAGPFIVVALSGPLLGERVSLMSWAAVATGFFAVLLVARPGFSEFSRYAVFPFVAAICYAAFQLLTRHLAAAKEEPATTLAWTLTVGVTVAIPLAIFTWVEMTATGWMLSIALGVVFGLAQLLLVRAFSHAPANILAPFSYAQIIAATIFGLIVFHDIPDLWTITGIALIIAAGVYVVRDAKPN